MTFCNAFSNNALFISSGNFNKRNLFAIVDCPFQVFVPMLLVLNYVTQSAFDMPQLPRLPLVPHVASFQLKFTEAVSVSFKFFIIAGTFSQPNFVAARKRLSPAIISYLSSSYCLTTIG